MTIVSSGNLSWLWSFYILIISITLLLGAMVYGLSTMDFTMIKHELISCERCGKRIECKANSYTKCQCSVVQLTLNEVQYIAENYEGCMCAACLVELQEEYRLSLSGSTAK